MPERSLHSLTVGPSDEPQRVLLVLCSPEDCRLPCRAKEELVSDGNTMIATTSQSTKLRIRRLGINAPEIGHNGKPDRPFGEEARVYFDRLIDGKAVRVDAHSPDQYNCLLAILRKNVPETSCEVSAQFPGGAILILGGRSRGGNAVRRIRW